MLLSRVMGLLYIIIFGICGVLARYYMGLLVSKHLVSIYPFGTFSINILGAFLIGVVYVFAVERAAVSEELRAGLLVGFLGGFTTFSSYCLESFRLIDEAKYWHAAAYFILSPFLGLLAAAAGTFLARFLMGGAL